MKQLFIGTVTGQHKASLPAALSVAIHGAVVALAFLVPRSSYLSQPTAQGPVLVTHLVSFRPEHLRANSPIGRTRVAVRANVVAKPAASHEIAQPETGRLRIGLLDPPVARPRLAVSSGTSSKVLVGALDNAVAGMKKGQPVGIVRPTDAFSAFSDGGSGSVFGGEHGLDVAARLLSVPTPSYNDEARRLNVTGEVVLEVNMRASGEVHVMRILSSLGHGLDEAAIDAVNQTRCRPAIKGGHPVDVIATIRVIFRLT